MHVSLSILNVEHHPQLEAGVRNCDLNARVTGFGYRAADARMGVNVEDAPDLVELGTLPALRVLSLARAINERQRRTASRVLVNMEINGAAVLPSPLCNVFGLSDLALRKNKEDAARP